MQPELLGLGRGRDREPGRAAAQSRLRAAGPVAVAVGLDDRAELGRPRGGLELPAVPLDRPDVDRRQGARHQIRAAQGARPAGIESITSVAITDSAAPFGGRRRPGAGVGEHRGAGGVRTAPCRGRSGRRSSRRGRRRCRRSPAPGSRTRLIATRLSSVTIVSSPLRTTIAAPDPSAASRALATRWRPISFESRRAAGPARRRAG